MIKIGITGHRPNKLWGYDYRETHYRNLKETFKSIIINIIQEDIKSGGDGILELISGMAIGTDTIYAVAAIELRMEGYKIKFVAVIPFKGQESRWPKESQRIYQLLLSMADEVVCVCDGGYAPWKMQTRNKYIVDRCDRMLSVWDGSPGGTKNCIDYAIKQNKPITNIKP